MRFHRHCRDSCHHTGTSQPQGFDLSPSWSVIICVALIAPFLRFRVLLAILAALGSPKRLISRGRNSSSYNTCCNGVTATTKYIGLTHRCGCGIRCCRTLCSLSWRLWLHRGCRTSSRERLQSFTQNLAEKFYHDDVGPGRANARKSG